MKVDLKLTEEETNTLENFINEIGKLDCSVIYCWACPFSIKVHRDDIQEHYECIIKEKLPFILKKYGYKETVDK